MFVMPLSTTAAAARHMLAGISSALYKCHSIVQQMVCVA